MTVAYAPDALIYNSSAGTWTLRADFNPFTHRVDIQFSDDDNILDGDSPGDELGTDTNQTAVIQDMLGNPVSSGVIYNEEYYKITMPSGDQYIDVLEIGGVVVGFLATDALVPGVSYPVTAIQDVHSGTAYSYSAYYDVACFAEGTFILTPKGPQRIDLLRVGDLVVTRDHGPQRIRWISDRRLTGHQLAARPDVRPVQLPGEQRPLILSPQHRVLLTAPKLELYFGVAEALAAAGHMTRAPVYVPASGIRYLHLLLDRHEVIRANGLWVESLLSGEASELAGGAVLPALPRHTKTARRCLRRWETEFVLHGSADAARRAA